MKTQVMIEITPDDLRVLIREEIAEVMQQVKPDKLLSRAQAAAMIDKSSQTIARMEQRRQIERITVAGQPRYRESDIVKFKKQ